MVYRGRVQHGVVEFEGPRPEDGTVVEVASLPPGEAHFAPGSPQAVLQAAGTWHGDPGEMERLLAELKADKWAEVEDQRGDADGSIPA